MPYRKTIAELEARMQELQAESVALEKLLEDLKAKQAKVGVVDNTRIISGVEVREEDTTQPA